jgi:hypothetical protein
VEHAKFEQDRLELIHLVGKAHLEVKVVELVESSLDIGLEVLRALLATLVELCRMGLAIISVSDIGASGEMKQLNLGALIHRQYRGL